MLVDGGVVKGRQCACARTCKHTRNLSVPHVQHRSHSTKLVLSGNVTAALYTSWLGWLHAAPTCTMLLHPLPASQRRDFVHKDEGAAGSDDDLQGFHERPMKPLPVRPPAQLTLQHAVPCKSAF